MLYTFERQTGPQYQLGGRSFYLEESAQGRVVFWKRALELYLPRHPFVGHGVGARPALEGQIPLVLYETGLLGLAAFFWFIFKFTQEAIRLWRGPPFPWAQGLAKGFLYGFLGIFIQSLFNNTFIIIRIMEPFWFLAGLIGAARRLANRQGIVPSISPHRPL